MMRQRQSLSVLISLFLLFVITTIYISTSYSASYSVNSSDSNTNIDNGGVNGDKMDSINQGTKEDNQPTISHVQSLLKYIQKYVQNEDYEQQIDEQQIDEQQIDEQIEEQEELIEDSSSSSSSSSLSQETPNKLTTLIVAGFQKCGTSVMSTYLGSHPEISFSKVKEVHYFDMKKKYTKGLQSYKKYWPAGGLEEVRALCRAIKNYSNL